MEYKDTVDEIWERIEAEINRQKISKKEVARRCGFDRKNLFGHRNMSIMYFAKICEVLNVSADYLLFGNEWEMEEC